MVTVFSYSQTALVFYLICIYVFYTYNFNLHLDNFTYCAQVKSNFIHHSNRDDTKSRAKLEPFLSVLHQHAYLYCIINKLFIESRN